MSESIDYVVAVVLDPTFGQRLRDLAKQFDLWVVPSSQNRTAVEQIWADKTSNNHQVTIWSEPINLELENSWQGIVSNVELHHGEYSHDPAVSTLEIIGAKPIPVARQVLAEFGFNIIEDTPEGFRARRTPLSNST